MKVGDLVKYDGDGDTGIILDIDADGMCDHRFFVHWSDGKEGWHIHSELEVLCK